MLVVELTKIARVIVHFTRMICAFSVTLSKVYASQLLNAQIRLLLN